MAFYLGFDVGATNTRAAVADADGTIVGRHDRPTPSGPNGRAIAEAVREAGQAACRDGDVDPAAVERATVATVAEIDRERGGVVDPANFPDGVEFLPLVDSLSALPSAEDVTLCNDATAGAIGERAFGDAADLVYLSLSTGVGVGVVADGRVLEGHRGNAGEFGHVTLDPDGRLRCGCGGDGHWEAYCSGSGIPRYARYLAEDEGVDTDLPLDDGGFEAADVFAAAGDDSLADRLLDRVAEWNARGVAAIVHAYDPEVIAVGGAVALENPARVVDPVRERLPDYLQVVSPPEFRLAGLGADAVLYGAVHGAVEGPR